MKLHLNPTLVANFFSLDCEKFLHLSNNRKRDDDSKPAPSPIEQDESPFKDAHLARGLIFEENLLERLRSEGYTTVDASRECIQDTLRQLDLDGGRVCIYQGNMSEDGLFARAFGHESGDAQLSWGTFKPDFIFVESFVTGEAEDTEGTTTAKHQLFVVDAKSSTRAKVSHMVQVTIYSMLLKLIIEDDEELRDSFCVSEEGGIWLESPCVRAINVDDLYRFELALLEPKLENFIRDKALFIARKGLDGSRWHFSQTCKGCSHQQQCRLDAEKEKTLGCVPYTTQTDKETILSLHARLHNRDREERVDNTEDEKLRRKSEVDMLYDIEDLMKNVKVDSSTTPSASKNVEVDSSTTPSASRHAADNPSDTRAGPTTAEVRWWRRYARLGKPDDASPMLQMLKSKRMQVVKTVPSFAFTSHCDVAMSISVSWDPFERLPFAVGMNVSVSGDKESIEQQMEELKLKDAEVPASSENLRQKFQKFSMSAVAEQPLTLEAAKVIVSEFVENLSGAFAALCDENGKRGEGNLLSSQIFTLDRTNANELLRIVEFGIAQLSPELSTKAWRCACFLLEKSELLYGEMRLKHDVQSGTKTINDILEDLKDLNVTPTKKPDRKEAERLHEKHIGPLPSPASKVAVRESAPLTLPLITAARSMFAFPETGWYSLRHLLKHLPPVSDEDGVEDAAATSVVSTPNDVMSVWRGDGVHAAKLAVQSTCRTLTIISRRMQKLLATSHGRLLQLQLPLLSPTLRTQLFHSFRHKTLEKLQYMAEVEVCSNIYNHKLERRMKTGKMLIGVAVSNVEIFDQKSPTKSPQTPLFSPGSPPHVVDGPAPTPSPKTPSGNATDAPECSSSPQTPRSPYLARGFQFLLNLEEGVEYVDCGVDELYEWFIVEDREGDGGPNKIPPELQFDDLNFMAQYVGGRNDSFKVKSFALASVATIDIHRQQLIITTRGGLQPRQGQRYVLFPRVVNFNFSKIAKTLRKLDREDNCDTVRLLEDTIEWASGTPAPQLSVQHREESKEERKDEHSIVANLRPSQKETFSHILNHRLTVVWGPPGTGKTHTLAACVLEMVRLARRKKVQFKVLVTAFTHSGIDNLLNKIDETKTAEVEDVPIEKLQKDSKKKIPADCFVVGLTVWELFKRENLGCFDLVVIDEASQMLVSDAVIALSRIEPKVGRLVVGGDHKQLQPITHVHWKSVERGEPYLHSSILHCLMRTAEGAPVAIREADGSTAFTVKLTENFRMNTSLTTVAQSVYGSHYTSLCSDRQLGVGDGGDGVAKALRQVKGMQEFDSPATAPSIVSCLLECSDNPRIEELLETEGDVVCQCGWALWEQFGRNTKIMIITPHRYQKEYILHRWNEKKREVDGADGKSTEMDIIVNTVEKVQGTEADAVFVCLGGIDSNRLRTTKEQDFLFSLARLNVSMTRARSLCVLIVSPMVHDPPSKTLESEERRDALSYLKHFMQKGLNLSVRCDPTP